IASGQAGTWMGEGMNFQRQSLLEPGLELRIGDIVRIAKNANRRATIDLFQALQDRTENGFVFRSVPQIIDGQDDHRFHSRLAHPLRRRELGELQVNVKGITLVEVSQTVS